MTHKFEAQNGGWIELAESDVSWIEDRPDGTVVVQTRSGPQYVLKGDTNSIYAHFAREASEAIGDQTDIKPQTGTLYYAHVFHCVPPDFLAAKPIRPYSCMPVVHILHTGSKEEVRNKAYAETNSVEKTWTESFGRYPRAIGTAYGKKFRSTATGDFILVENTVYRLLLTGWIEYNGVEALAFVFLIKEPYHMLQAAMQVLATKYQQPLSFGYIGNVYSDGPPEERDQRCWSVFHNGMRDGNSRWGRFSTDQLPAMAKRAKTLIDGKAMLERWVEALSCGDVKMAARYAYAFPTSK